MFSMTITSPKPMTPKKPRIWLVRLPDLRCFAAEAMTKSEARAQAKKHFQLQRLPVGTMVGEEL